MRSASGEYEYFSERTATIILKTKYRNTNSEMKNGKSAKPLNLLYDEKQRDSVYEVTFYGLQMTTHLELLLEMFGHAKATDDIYGMSPSYKLNS